jgi:imidazolonepropionase-like amidohydrolase
MNVPPLISKLQLCLLTCCGWAATPLPAQMRPVAIQDATLFVGTGQTIEHGTVVFSDGKITAAGKDAQPSFLARRIAGGGKYVTPGLLDAGSSVGLRYQYGSNAATARALDAFDRFAEDELRAAWRDGVTAVCLPARTSGGIGGVGAVVRLGGRSFASPNGEPGEVVLNKELALCAGLGLDGRPGPLARVRIATDLRRRFQAAKEYREAWEDYADSVKEYEEKLTIRAREGGVPGEPRRPTTDKAKSAPPKATEEGQGEKKEELKKPREPVKDRSAEMLLRVLDGELRLWVEANDPAEIADVLELAQECNIAVVIEGATGAHLLAARLAAAQVPVVLSEPPAPLGYVGGVERYARADDAAILHKAGVPIYFGSGRLESPTASPKLALRAARAVGYGLDADAALTALTGGAAKLLGVDKMIGRLESGLRADLVVWSEHPFAPGAVVERVFIAGREVYRAEGPAAEGEE